MPIALAPAWTLFPLCLLFCCHDFQDCELIIMSQSPIGCGVRPDCPPIPKVVSPSHNLLWKLPLLPFIVRHPLGLVFLGEFCFSF